MLAVWTHLKPLVVKFLMAASGVTVGGLGSVGSVTLMLLVLLHL